MQKITSSLWLNGQAEETMNFYASIFIDSEDRDQTLGQRRTGA